MKYQIQEGVVLEEICGEYLLTAVLMTLKKFFPGYQTMRQIPWYSFLDGKPWLLPAAWVYRFYFCLKNKSDESRAAVERPFAQKEEIPERQKSVSDWGL